MIYTMDVRVCTLFVSCVLIAISDAFNVGNITEYLNEALRSTKVKIVKSYLENASGSPTYKPEWKELLSEETEVHDHDIPLAMFDKIFTLVRDEEIISIGIEVTPQQLKPNITISIYRDALIRYTRPVRFIRSIIWDNSLCLLICYEDICSLHTSEGDFTLLHRQDFRTEGFPVDAKFMIKNNRLFIAIANNMGTHPVASVIYLWTRNHMDAIAEVAMTSVVSVTMFNDNRGAIVIIFCRREAHQSNMSSEVYELFNLDGNGTGIIRRIQSLPILGFTSLYHHVYYGLDFLLVVHETEAARLFWWHRREFLPWGQTNKIYGGDILIKNIPIDHDLYIFVAQSNSLSLFERQSESMDHLDILMSDNGVKIVDFHVWRDFVGNIFLVSILEQLNNSYVVESKRLLLNPSRQAQNENGKNIKSEAHEDLTMDTCLSRFRDRLKDRMIIIEKLHETRTSLNSFNASRPIPSPISEQQTMEPSEASADSIQNLNEEVDKLLIESQELIQYKTNGNGSGLVIFPSLVIKGDAHFQTLETPSIHVGFINDVAMDSVISKTSFTNESQHFSETLRGGHVAIHHLKVNSLCGIPKEYWLLKNDTLRSPLKPINQSINHSLIQINTDTVKIQTDANFQNIHTMTMNSINLPKVIDNLFIAGRRQTINGDLCYQGLLTINNLTLSGHLNGIDKKNLMTLTTNQNFTIPIKIDFLNVHHLVVNTLNGVPVKDAARVSRENVIHGKVFINHLKIEDEFLVKDSTAFTNTKRQIHLFDDVEIIGNVTVNRLRVEPQADITLGYNEKTKGQDVENLFISSWTKSTDQVISTPIVRFQKGITIDQLNTKYFNGLQEHEYLYTSIDSFPKEFEKIHFAKLFVKGSIKRGEKNNERLFDISGNSIIINRRVHIPYLSVQQLYVNRYNGMSIDMIMSDKISDDHPLSILFPNDTKLFELIINGRLEVDSLQYGTLNNRSIPENLNNTNGETRVNSEEDTSQVIDSWVDFYSTSDLSAPELDITIDGDLIIEDEMIINVSIDGQDVNEYLDHLSKSEIHINNELSIDNLTIHGDSSIEFLNDVQFDEFISSVLLKSKAQEFDSVSTNFKQLKTTNLDAKIINGFTPDQLHYTNDSMIFENNVTFTHLFADIEANSLNGLNISTDFFGEYLKWIQSLTRLNRLNVKGSITWEKDINGYMSHSKSLSTFLQNAVTREDEQTITAPTKFGSDNSNLYVVSFISAAPLYPNITEIIEDSVIDIRNSTVWISASKNFQDSVIIRDLDVDNNIDIANLNTMTFKELNDSLIRKFAKETIIEDDCTLIGEGINISHLISSNFGPNSPDISALFFFTDNVTNILSTNMYFEELIVRGNATVDYFDDIKFDKFMSERVSTSGNHVVYSKVQFTEPVQVIGETRIEHYINGIGANDFIINDTVEEQIIGTGSPIFFGDFSVEGNTNVTLINGIDISHIFEDGIMNDEPAVIESDLYILPHVGMSSGMIVSDLINDFNISEILTDWDLAPHKILEEMNESYMVASKRVDEGIRMIPHHNSFQLFSHMELDENLLFPHVQNTSKIVPVMEKNSIKFNIYSIQSGKFCAELPDDCPCRMQYIVQMTNNSIETIRVEKDQWIVYNFRDPNGWFEIKVKTNTMSSSPRCSLPNDQILSEHTIISLELLDPEKESFDFDYPIKINGYLHDAKTFVKNESVYIALAIGYDALHKTHQTNSHIYKLNLETNELILKLSVSVYAASVIEVFEINNENSYVFIGSALDESFLFKLDPTTDEFILVRSFPANSGATRHVKSLHYASDNFLFIDNAESDEIHVYYYDRIFDNFYLYQSLDTESPIISIGTFNIGESEYKNVFMVAATESGDFFLYEYMIYEKFQLKIKKQMGESVTVAPFHFFDHQYLLLIAPDSTAVVRIVVHG